MHCQKCGGLLWLSAEADEMGIIDKCLICGNRVLHWFHLPTWIGALPSDDPLVRKAHRRNRHPLDHDRSLGRTIYRCKIPGCKNTFRTRSSTGRYCPECRAKYNPHQLAALYKGEEVVIHRRGRHQHGTARVA